MALGTAYLLSLEITEDPTCLNISRIQWQEQTETISCSIADYLTEGLSGPDGDDKLLPRTTLEDPWSGEFAPEAGSIDATELWFEIAKPLLWEPWYPREITSELVVVASQRSRGLHWTINQSINFLTKENEIKNIMWWN